jgi:hypothetical protein
VNLNTGLRFRCSATPTPPGSGSRFCSTDSVSRAVIIGLSGRTWRAAVPVLCSQAGFRRCHFGASWRAGQGLLWGQGRRSVQGKSTSPTGSSCFPCVLTDDRCANPV